MQGKTFEETFVNNEEKAYADYLLLDSNGDPLAIVEVKKTSRDGASRFITVARIPLGEHLHPYTLDPAQEDKYHGKKQIYTRAKDPDHTGVNQSRHKHGRTVPQAQRPPADVS